MLVASNESMKVYIFGLDNRQREIRLVSQDRSGSVGILITRGLG